VVAIGRCQVSFERGYVPEQRTGRSRGRQASPIRRRTQFARIGFSTTANVRPVRFEPARQDSGALFRNLWRQE
jgi:hypothetical protein